MVNLDFCCLVRFSFFLLVTFICCGSLFAGELKVIRRDIEKDLSRIRIVPGVGVESSSQRRGVLLYKHPHPEAFIHFHLAAASRTLHFEKQESSDLFSLLKPELHFSLGSVSAAISFWKYFRYELGLELFTGGELIRFVEDEVREKHSRPYSLEIFSGLQFQPCRWARLDFGIQKELIEHTGIHGSVSSGFLVINWVNQDREILDLWLDGQLGFATRSHNEYLYGNGSGSGLSHYAIGLSFEWPKVFWDISIGNGINYSGLVGSNRHASFVEGHPDYFTLNLSVQRPI